MSRLITLTTFFAFGLFQTIAFPWLQFSGSTWPIVIVTLAIFSHFRPSLLISAAIAAGAGIDLASATPFGFWIVFMTISGATLQWLLGRPRAKWYWPTIWAVGVVAVKPLFQQLIDTNHLTIQYWPYLTLAPLLVVLVVVALPCWIFRQKDRSL